MKVLEQYWLQDKIQEIFPAKSD